MAEFEGRKVKVVAASVDAAEDAQKTVERHKLTFPVACGLSAKEVSTLTGAFFDAEKGYLHATGFILRPEGKIAGAVYSTGPTGRYTAAECLGMVDYLSKKAG